MDDLAAQPGQVVGQPDEGDVHAPVAQRRGLLPPVEPLRLDPHSRVPPGELRARPGGELPGTAASKPTRSRPETAAAVPVGGGR